MFPVIRNLCFLLLGFVSSIRAQEPCDTQLLFVVGRERDPFYNSSTKSPIKVCDVLAGDRWYRIKGPGEVDLDIYNSKPIRGRCETANPIWMRGAIPTGGAQVTNEMCVFDEVEDCTDQKPLPVKDCGTYRAYRLPSPSFCPSAYCVDFHNEPRTTTAPNCPTTIVRINVSPFVRPFVSESDDPELNKDRVYDELKFECKLSIVQPDWFYDVTWFINGLALAFHPTQVVGSEYGLTNLLERHWRDSFKMGMKVNCTVAARFQRNCVRGPEVSSEEFFAGIKVSSAYTVIERDGQTTAVISANCSLSVSPTNIVLNEMGEERNITYTCTVPISCQRNRLESCSVILTTSNSRNSVYTCPIPPSQRVQSQCQPSFTSDDWTQPKTLTIYSVYSNDFDNRNFVISAESKRYRHPDSPDIWEKVIPPIVRVAIIDIDRNLQQTLCQVKNDPVYYPFDRTNRYAFDNEMEGELVMFRHKTLPVRVHVLQETCEGFGTLTCVCGVAVQSGLDVFTWVGCNAVKQAYKQFRMRPFGCFKSGIRVEEISDGMEYKVYINNGIVVSIDLRWNIMEVEIVAPPDNQGQVEGMCGGLGPGGFDEIDPQDQWRVPDSKSLFRNIPTDDDRTFKISFCTCDDNKLECHPSTSKTLPCEPMGKDVTERFTYACGQKRDLILQDLDEEWPDFGFNLSYVPPPRVWMNGWNQQSAEEYCTDFHQNSEVYKRCSTVDGISLEGSIRMCVNMIHVTGNVSWSLLTLEPYKSDCRFEVTRNSSYWVSSSGQQPVFDSVLDVLCPDNCNGYGTCNKGVCECDSTHLGADCGIDITLPPDELVLPNKGLCDLDKKLCQGVLVIGSQFVNMDKFGCRLQTIQISQRGVNETGKMVQCKASYHTRNEALVIIDPFDDFASLGDVSTPTAIGYKLSITNDESIYSDDVIFLPHDSTCFLCDITDQNATCQIKEGYCNIDYQCLAPGTFKAGDSCYVCDPANSVLTWTKSGCSHSGDESFPLWIPIVASVGAICVVVIVVGLVARHIRKRRGVKA